MPVYPTSGTAIVTTAIPLPSNSTGGYCVAWKELNISAYCPSGATIVIDFYKGTETYATILAGTATSLYQHTVTTNTVATAEVIDLYSDAEARVAKSLKWKIAFTSDGTVQPTCSVTSLEAYDRDWFVYTLYPSGQVKNPAVVVNTMFGEESFHGLNRTYTTAYKGVYLPTTVGVTFLTPMDFNDVNNTAFDGSVEEDTLDTAIDSFINNLYDDDVTEWGFEDWKLDSIGELEVAPFNSAILKTVTFKSAFFRTDE